MNKINKIDIINVIKDIVAKRPCYTDKPNMVIIEDVYCGDDLIDGIEFNGDDDVLLYNGYNINGKSINDEYTIKQLICFTGRLIARYEYSEVLGADNEHYEFLVEDWVERHNKQEVFVVTAVTANGNYTPLSNRVFRNEDDAYVYLNSIIKSWKEEHNACDYKICCGYRNHKSDYPTKEFYGECKDGTMVHYTMKKIVVK
jgi:hypothetical protein